MQLFYLHLLTTKKKKRLLCHKLIRHLTFDVVACGVHIVQVHVKGRSRCQKNEFVEVVKLGMFDRLGECAAALVNIEKRFSEPFSIDVGQKMTWFKKKPILFVQNEEK